jgi:hypothetical protein
VHGASNAVNYTINDVASEVLGAQDPAVLQGAFDVVATDADVGQALQLFENPDVDSYEVVDTQANLNGLSVEEATAVVGATNQVSYSINDVASQVLVAV